MAEWIGGLLSGLPTWLTVVIVVIMFIVIAAGELIISASMRDKEPLWPFGRRNHDKK